jgi:hypothetical protein
MKGKPAVVNGPVDHLICCSPFPTASCGLIVVRRDGEAQGQLIEMDSPTLAQAQKFCLADGYAAFSVSQSNAPSVRNYIVRQEEHHRRMTYEQEVLALLRRHGVEYDPRFVFD